MNKQDFFKNYTLKTVNYELPDGKSIPIQELTLEQRGSLNKAINEDPIRSRARILVMSCPMFDEKDIDNILSMPGDLIIKITDAILDMSELGEEDEKN